MNDENEESMELVRSIEAYPPTDPDSGDTIRGFLGKFVMIAEWMDQDGNRYLVRRSGNGMGDSIPSWDVNGILFEALHGAFKN